MRNQDIVVTALNRRELA